MHKDITKQGSDRLLPTRKRIKKLKKRRNAAQIPTGFPNSVKTTKFNADSDWVWQPSNSRWSGDVIRRTGGKNFNTVSHNRARPYFGIQQGRDEVRSRLVYLNVHSVTRNVVDTEWSVEFWRWKYCREFGNNTLGRARLWDTALKFFFPVLRITSPDHLVRYIRAQWVYYKG